MIKIKKEYAEYLEKSNVDISGAIERDDLWEALEIIGDAVVDNIVDHNDEPDAHGIRLQRIYDCIRADNIDDY